MRVLNTDQKKDKKRFSRFSVPGFRSGSIIKKTIAILYYVFVVVFMCQLTFSYVKGDFSGTKDVFVLVLVELSVFAVFMTPVIAIGFSDHFDIHGIRLFMAIMVPICIFWTLVMWLSTLFSYTYIQSVNPSEVEKQIEITEEDPNASSAGIIDSDLIQQQAEEAISSSGSEH